METGPIAHRRNRKKFDASKRERVRNSEAWKKTQLTKDEIEKVLIQAKEKEIKIEKAWKQAKLQKEETKKVLMEAIVKEIESEKHNYTRKSCK